MNGLHKKLNNYVRAVESLRTGLESFDSCDDLQRDGIIQRFEYTFELAWKTIQEYLKDEGFANINSPKGALREAYAAGLISDEATWLSMLKDRNSTAHVYNEDIAVQIVANIANLYAPVLVLLKTDLENRISGS